MHHLVVVVLLMVFSVALAAGQGPNGKLIYVASCAGCHGLSGQGGTGGLTPNLKTTQKESYALFKRAMLQGINSKGKKFQPVMPTFGRTGFAPAYGQPPSGKPPTDAEMKAVLAHIKSLKIK